MLFDYQLVIFVNSDQSVVVLAYAYRRGYRGQHCPHSDSTIERSGKDVRSKCVVRNERNTMRTSCSVTKTTL